MTTETLSDKIFQIGEDCVYSEVLHEEDVREFIKELKEKLMNKFENKADGLIVNMLIDELAGAKLTDDENRCPYCNWINGEHMKECAKLTEDFK